VSIRLGEGGHREIWETVSANHLDRKITAPDMPYPEALDILKGAAFERSAQFLVHS